MRNAERGLTDAKLATRWQRGRDESARNALAERYVPLVRVVAERIAERLPDWVEIDDLISAGCLGLLAACDRWDPKRGVSFKSYAWYLIRSAILDDIRERDWLPRLARSRQKAVARATDRLTKKLARAPDDKELANAMHLTVRKLRRRRLNERDVRVLFLDQAFAETDSHKDVRELDLVANPREEDPARRAAGRSLWRQVMRGMSRTDRLIVLLTYYEGLSVAEVAKAVGLTEAGIYFRRRGIIERLRDDESAIRNLKSAIE
ncbi:MAG TPA: sigma-70 family RNA polymerase sigma factor [Phycisphaerae bacterium]|nr:sigma-70 family RNA polymerase sigma factor [Phycisphaerae bacterium]